MNSLLYLRILAMKLSNKLGILLILLQAADAILTAWGVNTFGIHAEGNPIVRFFISLLGVECGLAFVKAFAIIAIYFLAKVRATNVLLFLSGLYTSVVLMWVLAYIHN